jgi:hypothetical protein
MSRPLAYQKQILRVALIERTQSHKRSYDDSKILVFIKFAVTEMHDQVYWLGSRVLGVLFGSGSGMSAVLRLTSISYRIQNPL